MKKIANSQAREYVQYFKDFKGSNLSGEMKRHFYVVYSYGYWPLYAYDMHKQQWYENTSKYSKTTSRHKSQSRPIFMLCHDIISLERDALEAIIYKEEA